MGGHYALRVVLSNDVGIQVEHNEDTVRGPDVVYIRRDRLPDGSIPVGWIEFPPDLCVEVLSPSDRWHDVLDKVAEYLDFGVPEVWVADPHTHMLHIYRADSEPEILGDASIVESPVLPGFRVPVESLVQGG